MPIFSKMVFTNTLPLDCLQFPVLFIKFLCFHRWNAERLSNRIINSFYHMNNLYMLLFIVLYHVFFQLNNIFLHRLISNILMTPIYLEKQIFYFLNIFK